MTDRPTTGRSTTDRSTNGNEGASQRRESDAERTGVITEPGQPIHARPADGRGGSGGSGGDTEQAMPGGEPARGVAGRDVAGGAPPWQRGSSGPGGIDVGQPQHAGPPREADRPVEDAPTSVFASPVDHPDTADPDAPTGYFRPMTEPSEDRQPADREDDPGPMTGEQPVFENAPSASRTSTRVRASRAPRRASLQLKRFDPWSVLKLSLVLSVAGFLTWMVAVGVLYGVLEGMGVWDQLNGTYSDLTSVGNPQAGGDLISAGRVFGVAAVVGAINVVLVTAMATVGSFIYNVASDLAGGVELTLSERD